MIKRNLKLLSLTSLIALYSSATVASSAEVIGRAPDNTSGRLIGGWSAFLLGGAAAGPLGAIAGGLAGAFAGSQTQESAGLSGNIYWVRTDDGAVQRFRSPQHTFSKGDLVSINGIRIKPLTQTLSATQQ